MVHVLISTDVMITSPFPGLIMLATCSSAILNNIMAVDSVENFSDHLPVFFTLNCFTLSTHLRPILISQRNSTSDSLSTKMNWTKITEDDMT